MELVIVIVQSQSLSCCFVSVLVQAFSWCNNGRINEVGEVVSGHVRRSQRFLQ